MRLLVWNIQRGGGTRVPRIVEELAAHDADVIALTEYRPDRGVELRSALRERGWPHMETSDPREMESGIVVFSRSAVRRVPHHVRWLDLDLPEWGFGLGVLQIMAAVGSAKSPATVAKKRFWNDVLRAAGQRSERPFLFSGSWNTGAHGVDEKGRTFVCAEQFTALSNMGWVDLWRRHNAGPTEWTWRSAQGNGFRVDHAFASPVLASRVVSCRYSHAEREAKISDHSLTIVDLE